MDISEFKPFLNAQIAKTILQIASESSYGNELDAYNFICIKENLCTINIDFKYFPIKNIVIDIDTFLKIYQNLPNNVYSLRFENEKISLTHKIDKKLQNNLNFLYNLFKLMRKKTYVKLSILELNYNDGKVRSTCIFHNFGDLKTLNDYSKSILKFLCYICEVTESNGKKFYVFDSSINLDPSYEFSNSMMHS
ncbi:hypothetical protein EDEG_03167 [Edhazardia aedis USNM 41457]|uniref:Uncharacterized protein n=1 Tax=Edhazardia aedis (strain USNM 41457) TaxID=1003232 RepID=J8ZRT7_EDHAE|nr:hypothetical protein EDEG_03167 [Edhazardia aedis USNM 41457]|eukprot:EJW02408.1 hypothetical protein EDEG_03167 [Edhazardia aedis USNM 41457]